MLIPVELRCDILTDIYRIAKAQTWPPPLPSGKALRFLDDATWETPPAPVLTLKCQGNSCKIKTTKLLCNIRNCESGVLTSLRLILPHFDTAVWYAWSYSGWSAFHLLYSSLYTLQSLIYYRDFPGMPTSGHIDPASRCRNIFLAFPIPICEMEKIKPTNDALI